MTNKIQGNLYYYSDVHPVEVEIIIENKLAIARAYKVQRVNNKIEITSEFHEIEVSYFDKKNDIHIFQEKITIDELKKLLTKSNIKIDQLNSYGFTILKWNKHINAWSDSTKMYRRDRGVDFHEGPLQYYFDLSF